MSEELQGLLLERQAKGWVLVGRTDVGVHLQVPAQIEGVPVALVAARAFEGDAHLESVELPETVTFIGNYAFSSCPTLAYVRIPTSVTALNLGTFWNCPALTNIELPNTLEVIHDGTFRDCTALASIDIPDSVTEIGDRAFQGCTALSSIMLPDSVETVERSAFRGCRSLSAVVVHDSLTYIGPRAFQDCPQLDSVTVLGEHIDATLAAFANHGLTYLVPDLAVEQRLIPFEEACRLLTSNMPRVRLFAARVAVSYPDLVGSLPSKLSLMEILVHAGRTQELRVLQDKPGYFTRDNLAACIQVANSRARTETAAYLLDALAALDSDSGDSLEL